MKLMTCYEDVNGESVSADEIREASQRLDVSEKSIVNRVAVRDWPKEYALNVVGGVTLSAILSGLRTIDGGLLTRDGEEITPHEIQQSGIDHKVLADRVRNCKTWSRDEILNTPVKSPFIDDEGGGSFRGHGIKARRASRKNIRKAIHKLEYELTKDKEVLPVAQLFFAVLKQALLDVSGFNRFHRFTGWEYLAGDMPHSQAIGIDPDYVRRVLRQCGVSEDVTSEI